MKRIIVIGTIDETHTNISGQYDRTEIIKEGLTNKGYDVDFINMMNWQRNPIKLFASITKGYMKTDAVVFLASLNGTRVILNTLSALSIIKKKPVYQIAIGGQSNFMFVQGSSWYRKKVSQLSGVFVEVESMIDDYKTVGLTNVHYLPNCKEVNIVPDCIDNAGLKEPYRFCTYSRVTPEKGIAEAIGVVEELNREYGREYCTLDIYGTYLEEDKKWFHELMSKATAAITFKGRIERKNSISILSQYDLMLFPTQHTGEGVPGGMIDCYEAGLPIVTCDTSYMTRIVHDGKTGFIFKRGDNDDLKKKIQEYTDRMDMDSKKRLRVECQNEALKYDTESVINTLSEYIET